MVTSCAVDALCIAPGPMEAKETLPTRTFHATVLDFFFQQVLVVVAKGEYRESHDGAQNVAFVRVLMFQAQVGEHGCFVLTNCRTGQKQ